MVLFENIFIVVSFDETKRIVKGVWANTHLSSFDEEQFREAMLAWFEEVKRLQNVNVLADTRQFVFTIDLDTQTWINDHIIGLYPQYGVKKLGFLVSPNVFAQVSIEQTIEEKEQAFAVQYFQDEESTEKWLSCA